MREEKQETRVGEGEKNNEKKEKRPKTLISKHTNKKNSGGKRVNDGSVGYLVVYKYFISMKGIHFKRNN